MTTLSLLYKKQGGNFFFVCRYFKFIHSRLNKRIIGKTDRHHILPKAADFFPEYANLRTHVWNLVHLTHREHFIAHKILAKAFPNTSQTIAFYNMSNINGRKTGREYAVARAYHIQQLQKMTQDPERNRKISERLKGRPKSPEHVAKLIGHSVSAETREKLRQHNVGKSRTAKSIEKQQATRRERNITPKALSIESIEKMRYTKQQEQRRWYNNGIVSKSFTVKNPPPDNSWQLGRLPWCQ